MDDGFGFGIFVGFIGSVFLTLFILMFINPVGFNRVTASCYKQQTIATASGGFCDAMIKDLKEDTK